jgi:hypothetical protein
MTQTLTTQPPAAADTRPHRPRGSVPARLRLLLVVLIAAAVAWGALGAWTVGEHASAAHDVVTTSEPLSLDAQRMYQSLSDADVTATAAFLAGPQPSLAARQRYEADIARAAADLTALKDAAGDGARLASALSSVSGALPVYTGYVAQAQSGNALGFQLTGGSFMQVASETMHLTLLPAARTIYAQENAQLTAASARATGLPWIVVLIALTVITGYLLLRTQRWLRRRTHRVINVGLFLASLALAACTLWLIVAYAVARADLQDAAAHGSGPAETLSRAVTAAAQARGDEILNLISRSGDASFEQDFLAVEHRLGPGPGTLLTDAAAAASGGAAARPTVAAASDARAWYQANDQVAKLDLAADYAAETRLVIGTGPGSSAAGFRRLESDLGQAIAADQVIFSGKAATGSGAFGGLIVGVIVAGLLMAAGCARGLTRRLAEYR